MGGISVIGSAFAFGECQICSDASVDDNNPALLLATRFLGVNLAEFRKWSVKADHDSVREDCDFAQCHAGHGGQG